MVHINWLECTIIYNVGYAGSGEERINFSVVLAHITV